MPFRLEILGLPRIIDPQGAITDFPRGKPLALMGYLAVEDRPVARDELGRIFWPRATKERARHSVRQAIWLIRRTFGDDILQGDDPVSISGSSLISDLLEFKAALETGDLDRAESLWRGSLLFRMNLPDCRRWEHWREEKRESFQRDLFRGLMDRARAASGAGQEAGALEDLEKALALNPASAEAHLLRIETLLASNRIPGARKALDEAQKELQGFPEMEERLDELLGQIQRKDAKNDQERPERIGESVEFVGRYGELQDLKGAWARARKGHSGTACILGPTGIGKTRLASEFLLAVEDESETVVRARGYRREHRIPWGTVADLVRQLMEAPGAKGISSGSEALLLTVLPSLARNGDQPHTNNGLSDIHPVSLTDAVTDLVEAVGFEVPLVVFLDDWQWVDQESRALLATVIRRVRGLGCLFLLAERTGDRPPLHDGAESLIRESGGRRVTLSTLSEGELGELMGLLAEIEDPESVSELVSRVHSVTGGNPLFVGELLRKLAEDGAFYQRDGRWILDTPSIGPDLDLPESVQSLIRQRLERLSPTAGKVVAALAHEGRGVPARTLRRKAGLDETPFLRAMGQLADREIVVWSGATNVEFSHDQLREAAALFFKAPGKKKLLGWIPGPSSLLMTVPGILVAGLILIALGGSFVWPGWMRPDPGPAATYPFGRGRIILVGDPLLEVVPPAAEGSAWTVSPSNLWKPAVPVAQTDGPFRTPDGGILWFGEELMNEDPPRTIQYHPDGSRSVLFESRGDDGFHDLAPSSIRSLLMTQDLSAPVYRQTLVTLQRGDAEPILLYEANEFLQGSDWSPNGQRIALVVSGDPDTLLVLTPTGSVVGRMTVRDHRTVTGPDWCGDSRHLVLVGSGYRPGVGVLVDTETGTLREFGEGLLAIGHPRCLGKARGAVFLGVAGTGRWLYAQDFATDSITPIIEASSGFDWRPRWLPDEVDSPVWQLDISESELRLPWGSSHLLSAYGFRTNGTPAEVEVSWESSDPGVASVREDGLVTGNRIGQTVITAVHAGWIKDSLMVTVEEADENPGELLFRETFQDEDLPDWVIPADSTYPPPVVSEAVQGKVLSLRGDGRYRDYMETRESFPLQQGATLELEFRLPLTRTDRQKFMACLVEPAWGSTGGPYPGPLGGRRLCVHYPSRELSKWRDDLLNVATGLPGLIYEVEVAPMLPSEDWVHLAIQVRPDGILAVYVDRNQIFRSEAPVDIQSPAGWRIELSGASVDTSLEVRNLSLWRGERFIQDPSGP